MPPAEEAGNGDWRGWMNDPLVENGATTDLSEHVYDIRRLCIIWKLKQSE